jgi:[calcium/calmodulin-dependent protein kinase] kinase
MQQTLEVVQTSKLEKTIDIEGNSKINDYKVLSNLGAGAFGKVKLAQNSKNE